jgi:hypothetical protein
MTLRYAHLSPRYLADEVKALDLVQQNGKPQTKSDAEQASPSEKDHSEKESTEQDSGEDSTPAPTLRARRSRRSQKPVKAGKPEQPMHGIGKK